jgi:TonB-linked SusC/RagA family outer membrane protein
MAMSQKALILFLTVFFKASLQAQVNIYSGNASFDTIADITKNEIGLSYTQDKDKTIFSTKVDFAKLSFTNELSVYDMLQGKISGLDIISASGDPGKSAQVILRGYNFSGPNSPLIIIDGIPQKPLDNLFNLYNYNSEDIRSLIPVSLEDIRSVEVLKDGSSTSLYGAEGVNGVILIETKKGSPQKMGLTYQFNQSIIKEPSFIPMLTGDEYIMYQLEAWHNAEGVFEVPPEIAYDRDYSGFYNYSANTNWLNAVTQTGYASNHYLNIFGGNKKNRYFGSINYLDQRGTIINTGYNRLLSRLNFEHYFTKKLTLTLNLNYANNKYNDNIVVEDEYGNGKNILEMAFIKAPNMSIWEHDADGNRTGAYFTPIHNYQGSGYDYFNPVAISESGNATNTLNELMTTAHLQYDFKDWLRFRESFSYNRSSALSKTYLPFSALASGWMGTDINNRSDLEFEQFRNEIQTLVKIPFKDEKKNMLNGTFTWIMQDENYSIKPENIIPFYNAPEKNRDAAVSSLYYRLLDRYILNVNTRFESVSTNHDRNTWDSHYGVSTGWRFSNEPFFKKFQFLNNGMIHAGWSFSEYHPTAVFTTSYSLIVSNNQIYLVSVDETRYTQSFNSGLELALLDNRIRLNTDYYNKKTEANYNYWFRPPTMLKLRNKGWEFMVDYEIIRKKNLDWRVQFNMAHNNQTLLKVPDDINNSESTTLRNGNFVSYLFENKSPGSIYGLIQEGVYPTDEDAVALDKEGNILVDGLGTPVMLSYSSSGAGKYTFRGGDVKYRDMNYDGIIDENDVVYLGNSFPKVTGGFGSTVTFQNLTLTCNFHYRTGYKIINQIAMSSEDLSSKNNQGKNALNRWRVQGQHEKGMLPRAYMNHPANNLGSDAYVENGSFIRMNYISLGYNFKSEICQRFHVKDLFLSISAQRLFTFSTYRGLDPETETETGNWLNKDEIRVYPPKIYTISIRVSI